MARYTGPKTKIARKFKEPIYGPDKYFERKNYAPGQHGQSRRRTKLSEYGMQLQEKQKAKYTGQNLMQLIESRLDNVVFRLGIAPTRNAARQLVTHRHITVNGQISNIPSMLLKPGDTVEVRERSKSLEVIENSLSGKAMNYAWLEWDGNLKVGKFMQYPQREEIPETINEQAIVELYSK